MNLTTLAEKQSNGWPDAIGKIASLGVGLCTLIMFLVNRHDQQKVNDQHKRESTVNRRAIEYMAGTNAVQKIDRETK
jgi:hypothetical protein